MTHDTVMFTEEFWDERYGSTDRVWSGNPNPQLVSTAEGLEPGNALDVACGEGADAIWLAERGWTVTGMDVSGVALRRAAEEAGKAGVTDRISWERADAFTWDPTPRTFDLVSAQFVRIPREALESLHRRMAAAVRPGGTLLIVGHHHADLETTIGRPHHPELMFTAEQVTAVLDPDTWRISTTEPQRPAVDPDGRTVTIRDVVVRAVRI